MGNATFLVVLAAAGAAFGIGYFVGTSLQPPTTIAEDEIPEVDATIRPERGTLVRGSAGPALEGGPTDKPGIRAVVASFPVPDRESGSGTITGTVRTVDLAPVAGVTIKATPRRDESSGPRPQDIEDPDERLVQMVAYQIQRARWIQANEVSTTTDADGTFTLTGLGDTRHRLQAKLKGWRFDAQGAYNVKPGGKVAFEASRVSGVHLDIFGPDGVVPERASLSFHQGEHTRHGQGWRSNKKLAEIKPGVYDLHITAGEHGEMQAGPIEVEVSADETAELRVDLELRPVLLIDVEFPEGEATTGNLYMMPTAESTPPTGAVLRARGKQEWLHKSGRQGWGRTFKEVKEGRVAVGYCRGHQGAFDVIELFEIGPGLNEHVLKVPKLDPGRYAVIRVYGPDGKPVQNVNFSTGFLGASFSSSGGATVVTRPGGEYYVLDNEHGHDQKEGVYWVNVQAGKFGSQRIEYKQGDTRSFTVRFAPPASADIVVSNVDALGDGQVAKVALAKIEKNAENRQNRHGGDTKTLDEGGKVSFKSLQPGAYRLTVTVGQRHWPATVHTEDVTIRAGKNAVAISLPPLYSVTVRNAANHVWLQRLGDKGETTAQRHVQAAEGEAVVDALPAGRYRARSHRKRAEFEVPGTTVVTLEEPKK